MPIARTHNANVMTVMQIVIHIRGVKPKYVITMQGVVPVTNPVIPMNTAVINSV